MIPKNLQLIFYSSYLVLLALTTLFGWFCQTPERQKPFPKSEGTTTAATSPDSGTIKIDAINYDYDTEQWTDIGVAEPTILLDLKYATADNFVQEKLYDCARCFLRPPVAAALINVHQKLQQQHLGLKIFDCYRPWSVQKKLWEKVPNPNYVTPPQRGSMHNKGLAVDLTIVDEKGLELNMGTSFDFFGRAAHHDYGQHSAEILANRKLLKEIMHEFGFRSIRTEWWHYSFSHSQYSLADMLWNCPE